MIPDRNASLLRGLRGGIGTAGSQVFLPFEGDGLLAIILSKAFLLADDRSITDPSITRQLDLSRRAD